MTPMMFVPFVVALVFGYFAYWKVTPHKPLINAPFSVLLFLAHFVGGLVICLWPLMHHTRGLSHEAVILARTGLGIMFASVVYEVVFLDGLSTILNRYLRKEWWLSFKQFRLA